MVALAAGATGLGRAQLLEQVRVLPDFLESTVFHDVSGEELLVNREGACVHVTDRVDQAHDAARTTEIETGQCIAEGGEVEERVARQDAFAIGDQPVVELTLLLRTRVQVVPHVGAAARRTQSSDAQGRVVLVRESLELVELTDVVPA